MSIRAWAHAKRSSRPAGGYDFTQDWFSNHIPAWDAVLTRLRPTRIIEVGCYEGRATTFLIETCSAFGPLSMRCIDTWAGSLDLSPEQMSGVEGRFDRNVKLAIEGMGDRVTVEKLKQPSALALARLIASGCDPVDLIYVDGSHTAPDVLADAVLAFRLLRTGGVMIFDDYLWCMQPTDGPDLLNTPKLAIDAFTLVYARKARILPGFGNLQCFVEKVAV